MEKGKRLVLDQDRSSHKGLGNLRHREQGVEEQSKEAGSGLYEQSSSSIRGVVEEGTSDESLHNGRKLLDEEGGLVTPDDLVLTLDASLYLHGKTDGEWARCRQSFVLLQGHSLLEQLGLGLGFCCGRIVVFGFCLFKDRCLLVLVANGGSRPRKLELHLISNPSLGRYGNTGQVVSHIGAVAADEAQALHERASLTHGAVVDFLSLVENEDLVEEVVDAVASLVQGDYRG